MKIVNIRYNHTAHLLPVIYELQEQNIMSLRTVPTHSAFTICIAAIWLYCTPAAAQNFLVGIDLDKKISVQADNANLKDVLLEIQAKTGIPVSFVAESTERVSVEIIGQSIEDAIGKLTPNFMIMRDSLNGKEAISEIIIISDDPAATSGGDGSSFLPSGQPAPAITETNNSPVTPSPDSNENPPSPSPGEPTEPPDQPSPVSPNN